MEKSIVERIQKIKDKSEEVMKILEGTDQDEKKHLREEEKIAFEHTMSRFQNQMSNGKAHALRQMTETEFNYFHDIEKLSKMNPDQIIKSEEMSKAEAKEEMSYLYWEYTLDSIEQSLRSALLVYMNKYDDTDS